MSSIVTEKGFSINHEFDGGRHKKGLEIITIKEWGGAAYSNVIFIAADEEGYGTVSVGGESYSDSKIIDKDTSLEGNQVFTTTTVEQKIKKVEGCEGGLIGGLKEDLVDDYSKTITTSKTKEEISMEMTISISIAKDASLKSAPSSISGSALVDSAVSAAKVELDQFNWSDHVFDSNAKDKLSSVSGDDSDGDCNGDGGDAGMSVNFSENIDRAACRASITKIIKKKLGEECEDKKNGCNFEDSSSTSQGDRGLISATYSGSSRGVKDIYECDGSGNKTEDIKKTKMEFAEECFEDIDLEKKILEIIDEAAEDSDDEDGGDGDGDDDCSNDVCTAIKLTSKSITRCEDDGSITWNISASEEEVSTTMGASSNLKIKKKEKTNKNGCTSTITRSWDASIAVDNSSPVPQVKSKPIYLRGDCSGSDGSDSKTPGGAEDALLGAVGDLDFSAPGGFYGPISLSLNVSPSSGTLSGSASFSNDPKYKEVDTDSIVKSSTTTTTVCPPKKPEMNSKKIPCGQNPATKSSAAKKPGHTRQCIEAEFYPCATIEDIKGHLTLTPPGDAAQVTEDTVQISMSDGGKSGSACIQYSTKDDLGQGNCE